MKMKYEARHAYKPDTQEMGRLGSLHAKAKAWMGFRTVERTVDAPAEVRQAVSSDDTTLQWVEARTAKIPIGGVLTPRGWESQIDYETAAAARQEAARNPALHPRSAVKTEGHVFGAFSTPALQAEMAADVALTPSPVPEYVSRHAAHDNNSGPEYAWHNVTTSLGDIIVADMAAHQSQGPVVGSEEGGQASHPMADASRYN